MCFLSITRDDLTFTYTPVTQVAVALADTAVDFAVAEKPIFKPVSDASGGQLAQLPMAASAVVVGYNLPNATAGTLVLDIPTLARIWRRDITVWNHAAIVALNPALASTLTSDPIALVYKQAADQLEADVTAAFVQALSHDAAFKSAITAAGGTLYSMLGTSGHPISNQSQAISLLNSTSYTMGYFALRDANRIGIKYAAMNDANGTTVQASTTSVQAAMSYYRETVIAQQFVADISNGANGSWPLSFLASVVLVTQNRTDSNKCVMLKDIIDHLSWIQARHPPPSNATACQSC